MHSHTMNSTNHTMTHTTKKSHRRSMVSAAHAVTCWLRPSILFAAVAIFCISAARQANAGTFSYSVDITSSLALMESPSNPSTQLQVSQQSGLVDRVASNSPIVSITNTSTSDTISSIQLNLNDPESVIEAMKVLSSDGVATGAFANDVYAGPATSIDISFPTALAPGQTVTFAVELAPVNGYTDIGWTPGYDNIFWPTNNPIPGTNASLTVTYNQPDGDPTVTNVLPDLAAMTNVVTVDPSTTCSNSGTPTSLVTTNFSVPPTPTPEPGTIMLLMLCGIPMAVQAWRKRCPTAAAIAS